MKKLVILSLALTAVFTACKDRDQTPAPTGIGKIPTLPVDTIDIRDIAAGTFIDSTTMDFVVEASFVTDTTTIDRMFLYDGDELGDIISIESEDFGFVFFGSSLTREKIDGYYTLETDIWTVRVISGDTTVLNFERVN